MKLFAFLWAQAQIFIVAPFVHYGIIDIHALVCLVALVTLAKPCKETLNLLALTSTVRLGLHGAMSNHVFTIILVNAMILLNSGDDLRESIRVFSQVLYFGTGIHKCNSGFINPDVSCGAQTTGLVLSRMGISSTSPFATLTMATSTWVPLVAELVLPFLLYSRLGCALGILFHLFLVFPLPPSSYYPFSIPMLCCYSLIVAKERIEVGWLWKSIPMMSLAVFWQTKDDETRRLEYPPYDLHTVAEFWCVMTSIFLLAVLYLGDLPVAKASGTAFHCLRRLFIPSLLGVIFLTPYLGLRVYSGVFAMFSNLRVEGCNPNHFFIPTLDLFGEMNDAVRVEKTNVPSLLHFQVDLAESFRPDDRNYLKSFNMKPALWICPPSWEQDATFQSYAIPRIEMRRALLKNKSRMNDEHFVDYREHAGCNTECGQADGRIKTGNTCDKWGPVKQWTPKDHVEELQWWHSLLRYRSFGTDDPCRH